MKNKNLITINFSGFSLSIFKNGEKFNFPVSCAEKGLGEKAGSNKTPRGMHKIYKKIGRNAQIGAIFESRKETGEIINFCEEESRDNLILTRILWLDGLEKHNENTKKRYIYIHGTNRENDVGRINVSHGCIIMKNSDIIQLFDLVKEGDYVFIY